ncbi:MAG: DNA topoisomerase [Phycisphaerales bacterium]
MFKATGRVLVFDGFYRVSGVPTGGDEQTLPKLSERQALSPFAIMAEQRFTSAPRAARGEPDQDARERGDQAPVHVRLDHRTIQDRKCVEQLKRAFYATDLGEVVTDKLIEAFPRIMEVGYTRQMEEQLDKIEEGTSTGSTCSSGSTGGFNQSLERAHEG